MTGIIGVILITIFLLAEEYLLSALVLIITPILILESISSSLSVIIKELREIKEKPSYSWEIRNIEEELRKISKMLEK